MDSVSRRRGRGRWRNRNRKRCWPLDSFVAGMLGWLQLLGGGRVDQDLLAKVASTRITKREAGGLDWKGKNQKSTVDGPAFPVSGVSALPTDF